MGQLWTTWLHTTQQLRRDRRAVARSRQAALTPDLRAIHSQIRRFSGLRARWLSFPSALERHFETDTRGPRCKRLWFEGLLALILFDLFLLADHANGPVAFHQALLIRLALITPLALLANLFMLSQPRQFPRESSVALVGCMAGLTHLYLTRQTAGIFSADAQLGLLAVLIFVNAVMRLRVPYALVTTAVLTSVDLTLLLTDPSLTGRDRFADTALILGIASVTQIANYSLCREERLNFLLCLQGDVTVRRLNEANAKLLRLAEQDMLTGLANRRLFEATVSRVWQEAFLARRPVAMLVVDIDHFKKINDTFGHPYGDKVLARIGRLLGEALRRKDDLAVRYGGEEFVILLPDTDLPCALTVGERLCDLVRLAGLPGVDTPGISMRGRSATISCGVAAQVPSEESGYESLLLSADQALYRAKLGGRDRVCCAEEPDPQARMTASGETWRPGPVRLVG